MLKLVRKLIREDVTTPFFSEINPDMGEYLKITYVDTKKLISQTHESTEYSQTLTMVFRSVDDFVEFALDSNQLVRYFVRKQHLYNLKNNIRIENQYIEE